MKNQESASDTLNNQTNTVNTQSETLEKIENLKKLFSKLLTPNTKNKETILKNISDSIIETIKFTSNNSNLNLKEKEAMNELIESMDQHFKSKENIKTVESILPSLINSIEQVIETLSSTQP